MTIELIDGSILTCSEIYISGNNLICDDYRIVPIDEVKIIIDIVK